MPKVVYIAMAYRAPTQWLVEQNIRRAEALAYEVAKLGAYPCCVHSMTRGYFEDVQPAQFWLDGTLALMKRCDAVLMGDGWELSTGATNERRVALAIDMPVFHALDELAQWLEVQRA